MLIDKRAYLQSNRQDIKKYGLPAKIFKFLLPARTKRYVSGGQIANFSSAYLDMLSPNSQFSHRNLKILARH
ncbi:MAG: hypothetical protein A2743_03915 [Candidatus Taylorbacteria bacterium RIFCSPHIGHO2_01_FULL_43_47]|nr:MAG: hypothetical protein A2743_03915 [Candidatus Taylorbacteria bacterium RIFCSPHIGHO2_01_FULL_43_47]